MSTVDACLTRLREPGFDTHVWTDDLTVREVADHVAASASMTPAPNTDTGLRGCVHRSWTSLKHIRFD